MRLGLREFCRTKKRTSGQPIYQIEMHIRAYSNILLIVKCEEVRVLRECLLVGFNRSRRKECNSFSPT